MRYTLSPEERRQRDRAYYAKTKERRRELVKLAYKNNKERYYINNRKGVIKRKYGLTFEEYKQMFDAQQGLCFICKKREEHCTLAVDHNHETRQVRMLLCGNCNRALGLFKDDPDLLEKAAEYLRSYGG